MAVAIIRQLTLAQVQAAIDAGSTSWNNNYAGTQVYVTDKDWHLACYLDRIAKPLSGVLKITNGDTLPNWLTPETLLIDTGTITVDINTTPVSIAFPSGYHCIGIRQLAIVTEDIISGIALADATPTTKTGNTGDFTTGNYYINEYHGSDPSYPHTSVSPLSLTCSYWGGGSIRAIIECIKSVL